MGKILLSNIAEELATKGGLTREAADTFVHAFIATIEQGLRADGVVKVKGLGTFKLQEVSDRDSVDVNTGERITIKGYRKVTFTPDSAMKELVNRPFAHFEPTELHDGYPTEEERGTSEDVADDNDGVEAVEESVETMEEETAVVVKTLREEVSETVETSPTVEIVADEQVAEDTVEDVVEKGIEQSTPVQEGAPEQEEVVIREEAPEKEPKKSRGFGCVVTLFLLLALAVVLAFAWFSLSEADEIHNDKADVEYSDIVVKPNLEEELGAEWNDVVKVETGQSTGKQDSPIVPEVSPVSAARSETDDTTRQKAQKSIAPQTERAPEPVVPAEASVGVVTLVESISAKAVKDITVADTTDYVMDGTLVTHRLKSGETIIQLAKKYYNDKRLWPYIVKYNKISDFNKVAIGQEVLIPVLKER